ncbi:tumor necrosis factor ligand superfamily member 18 [Fundulus heteroclitus]|uniref:tumor necrosis factor ligand superfamily member 18 n=1 Tax=Fundulus heteroclitus TaxID=8078 RepID=UPI00165C0D18|nr:tumor necrosis factor ligand superfamily member 18 [Fundulus heteroclitus]
MPQRSQHPLIYVLLIWTSIVTIILFVFITLFFIPGQSSNSSTVGHTSPLHITPSSPEILNLKASEGRQSTIKWTTMQSDSSLILKGSGETIKFLKDGNYILNFQVTLSPCDEGPVSNTAHSVTLKLDGKDKLVGWINTNSNSTGLLSRILRLAAGTVLVISIDPAACVNTTVSMTHLDIIWLY